MYCNKLLINKNMYREWFIFKPYLDKCNSVRKFYIFYNSVSWFLVCLQFKHCGLVLSQERSFDHLTLASGMDRTVIYFAYYWLTVQVALIWIQGKHNIQTKVSFRKGASNAIHLQVLCKIIIINWVKYII